MKLPNCSIYRTWTPYGEEVDCEAIHEEPCEDCLCNYDITGGLFDPKNGKKLNPIIARFMYGECFEGENNER